MRAESRSGHVHGSKDGIIRGAFCQSKMHRRDFQLQDTPSTPGYLRTV